MHGEKLPRIDAKLSYLEREKPKWYVKDERVLSNYERHLDEEIKRVDKQKPKKNKPRFELPRGIAEAERGR